MNYLLITWRYVSLSLYLCQESRIQALEREVKALEGERVKKKTEDRVGTGTHTLDPDRPQEKLLKTKVQYIGPRQMAM